jgi:hypothetical protein
MNYVKTNCLKNIQAKFTMNNLNSQMKQVDAEDQAREEKWFLKRMYPGHDLDTLVQIWTRLGNAGTNLDTSMNP